MTTDTTTGEQRPLYELATDLGAPVPSPEQARARQIAAGYTALGDFFVAHPHLLRDIHMPMSVMLRSFYGTTARERIDEFVAAARQTPGVELEEYYDRPYGGVRLTFAGSVQYRVYANQGDLGASRTARTRKYRPLLGDDTTTGGAE